MLDPITRPTGWKPTSLTSRNSFTDRSEVKNLCWRICVSRSRACTGRTAAGAGSGGTNCWSSACVTVALRAPDGIGSTTVSERVACENCGAPKQHGAECEYCSATVGRALDPGVLAATLVGADGDIEIAIVTIAAKLVESFPQHAQVEHSG